MRPWESVSAPERVSPPAGQAAAGGRATVGQSARFRVRLASAVLTTPPAARAGRRPASAFRAQACFSASPGPTASVGAAPCVGLASRLVGRAHPGRALPAATGTWRDSLLTEGGAGGCEPRGFGRPRQATSLTHHRNIVHRAPGRSHAMTGPVPQAHSLQASRHAPKSGIMAARNPQRTLSRLLALEFGRSPSFTIHVAAFSLTPSGPSGPQALIALPAASRLGVRDFPAESCPEPRPANKLPASLRGRRFQPARHGQ